MNRSSIDKRAPQQSLRRAKAYRALGIAAAALMGASTSAADAPTVSIVAPLTGTTIFCSSFPCPAPTLIEFNIGHTSLSNLVQLRVNVDGVQLLDVNPFTNGPTANLCTADLIAATTSCITNGPSPGDSANVKFPWTPQAAAQDISIMVSVRHSPNTTSDTEEQIDVVLASVEYPAPPSVANAFLNNSGQVVKRSLTASVRGCILSQIAQNHADSYYGPKGGPYNIPLIEADALGYYYACL